MLKRVFLLISLIFSLFISGCEPTVFGVSQSTWNTLSPSQRQQVIDGYNYRKAIETQNAPLQNAINTAGFILQKP